MIYVNEIENSITFKIKTGYYLELLVPETMKLSGSTKSKINKDKNGEDGSHIEITEVILPTRQIHVCRMLHAFFLGESRNSIVVFSRLFLIFAECL